jgi:hypothetical protein
MAYQMIQDSPWRVILMSVGLVLIVVAIVTAALNTDKPGRLKVSILVAMIVIGFGCLGGEFMVSKQHDAQNDVSFSKQLMDEYHVTSSRTFYDIKSDLLQSKDASTIFTQDGKDTPVFVKLVSRDGQQYKMAFTVLDEKSLYAKPIR